MIEIATRAEYDYIVSRGFQPLINWRMFKLEIELRKQIQYDTFGSSGDFVKQNDKFYHWVWENSLHFCHETGRPLESYSSVFVSHIISRGANRFMAIDPRNANILCYNAHQAWEGKYNYKMNIFRQNQLIIKLLKNDYNNC